MSPTLPATVSLTDRAERGVDGATTSGAALDPLHHLPRQDAEAHDAAVAGGFDRHVQIRTQEAPDNHAA